MQITGQILNVAPRLKDEYPETFTTPNGQFFVFEMAIQQPGGPTVGQIYSKSPQYPLQIGEQITVDLVQDTHGLKFKRINPQYNQQPPQPGYGQSPPGYGQGYPPQPPPPQDNVQDRIQFAQALNLAVSEYVNEQIIETQIKERARIYYHILKSRAFPPSMSSDPPQPEPQQTTTAQFNPNAAFNPEDDIPF